MPIVQTQTTSFKKELYQGIHDLTTDVLKIALYTANADLNEDTTVYTMTAEIIGTGYVLGGKTLTGTTISSSGYTAFVDFDNVEWNPGVFTARCALIYNSSKANRSIAVLDFGSDKTSTATFTIVMPVNDANSALIRSSN
jgi:hypothetical protein